MRESKAKKRILETAERMIRGVGYGGLNVNHVAEEAGVSIGTLYYHFPEGKVSILLETRGLISERYEEELREKLGEGFLDGIDSFDEGLDRLLEALIQTHRESRFIIAAMESEVLGNLGVYDELAANVNVEELMEQDARFFLDALGSLLEKYTVKGMSLQHGVLVSKIVDALMHRFVFFESMFGPIEVFKETVTSVIYALLTEKPRLDDAGLNDLE
jgi:AcrR family transcriptional regulator